MAEYRIRENSMHERFMNSRAKIQIIGGGFGNGKTAAVCVKTIKIAQEYPGANILMARATFPKLNDTIKKEFKKWIPESIVRSFPESKNSDNTVKLTNGTMVNMRYIAQQGKNAEQTTSNLLSATYDLAIIDQMEDPEITEKDFYDILGRMRGNAVYRGNDPTMPKSGPRWLFLTCNPTANWFYRRIILPYQRYIATGEIHPDLLCERDANEQPIIIDGKPILLMELFEGATYENRDNLGADFIKTLESTYKGQMKDRFLLGKWAAYEGLVYPEYSEIIHTVPHRDMEEYLNDIARYGKPTFLEALDFGIPTPSCYLLGFVDHLGIVHILDGFYGAEIPIRDQINRIKAIRNKYGVGDELILADPSLFRRSASMNGQIGPLTSEIYYDAGKGVRLRRANNDIDSGILKVKAYLSQYNYIRNPYRGDSPSPRMFVSDELEFFRDEITAYMWDKKNNGQFSEKPKDVNDHAMDTAKYLLTDMPGPAEMSEPRSLVPRYMLWREDDFQEAR